MRPIGYPKTSVATYPSVLRKIPEERRPQLRCSRSLICCMVSWYYTFHAVKIQNLNRWTAS